MRVFTYVHFFYITHIFWLFNGFANWLLPVSLTNLIISEVSFAKYKRRNAVFLLPSAPRRITGLKRKLIGFALGVERRVRLWFHYFKLYRFRRYRYRRVIFCRMKMFRKKDTVRHHCYRFAPTPRYKTISTSLVWYVTRYLDKKKDQSHAMTGTRRFTIVAYRDSSFITIITCSIHASCKFRSFLKVGFFFIDADSRRAFRALFYLLVSPLLFL